jgi:ATP-dependent protease ClpP protease subunit
MIQVTNSADTAKVLISGEIGQGWFTDGFTLEKLKNSIGSDDISNIELEINSLGGDLIEALAIYDSLKTSNAKVKAKIVGSTASAGTVIAMAADTVEITENSNFLIHRASTMAGGTVDDMEKAAQQLEMFDAQLLNIYQKKTGKRKSQLSGLMKDDKWIKPTEALEWGFVDKVIKSQILNQVNMDTTELKKVLGVETDEEILTAVNALIAENESLKSAATENQAKEEEKKEVEITDYVTAAIAAGKITATVKDSMINLAKTDFEAVKNIIETAKPAPLVNLIDEGKEPETKMTKEEATKIYNSWKLKNKVGRMAQDDPDKYMEVRNAMKG